VAIDKLIAAAQGESQSEGQGWRLIREWAGRLRWRTFAHRSQDNEVTVTIRFPAERPQ
jgi:hypothetical protein